MNKRIVLGVGGGLLLAIGLVLGIIVGPSLQALAAGSHPSAAKTTPTPTDYCQLYIQTVSKDLGVSQSKLESANKDAMQTVINKLYADGQITQAQQAQAQQQLSEYGNNPCAALQTLAKAKSAPSATSGQAQAVKGARAALMTAVAGALKTSSGALQSELSAGKTVAQITTEKGVSKSAVDSAYLNAAQTELAKAVSDGSLTQAQSSMASTFLQQAVSAGHYPLLDADSGSSSFGAGLPAGLMNGQ
ncbi:MAG TPA: hypothetical protein VE338_06705 [Ktedonobacterales bacterium]|jgi:competence protein ComGC|nr:hypothetical protein [Ktedonobacterales bacterium]